MFIKKFFQNQEGTVLALTAIFLPVVLIVGGLIVDGGKLYIRHSELKNLARQAANSSVIELSKQLEIRAQTLKNNQCLVELPPAVCDSTNLFDFLTRSELEALLANVSLVNDIKAAATNFAITFDPAIQVSAENVESQVPYLYSNSASEVRVKVVITSNPPLTFLSFFDARELQIEAESYLKTTF